MKANELMIGDWVECTYWTPSKQLKVAEIRRIMDDEIKIGVYSDDLVLIFRQSEVKPIPLTPEILEKNGFVESPHYPMVFRIIEDNLRVAINMDGGLYLGIIKTFDDGSEEFNYNTPKPKSVHELQHALRLCGIDKNIEL